jgi:VWFA-related protein
MKRLVVAVLLSLACARAATRLLVTVIDQKSGKPVTGLSAGEFTVTDDNRPRKVESAEPFTGPLDVMLVLDTSQLGGALQPAAESLVGQLQPKDQMAIVAFHSSADLIQDFTSSRELLIRAISSVKYGNAPRILDALYAATEGGFRGSAFRRVIVLVTAGVEGPSRSTEREVLRLARRNGVSIYPVFASDQELPLFERLARQTGGAFFSLRGIKRAAGPQATPRVLDVVRSCYTLSVEGNMFLGDRLKIEVKRPERLVVSGLPLD